MTAIIKLEGEWTVQQVKVLQEELLQKLENDEEEVTLDLSELEEIDFSGIQLLLSARNSAKLWGKEIYVKGPLTRRVEESFELCGLLRYFTN